MLTVRSCSAVIVGDVHSFCAQLLCKDAVRTCDFCVYGKLLDTIPVRDGNYHRKRTDLHTSCRKVYRGVDMHVSTYTFRPTSPTSRLTLLATGFATGPLLRFPTLHVLIPVFSE